MNRRPSGLKTEKAISGFLQYKTAEGLIPATLVNYAHHLHLWATRAGDLEIEQLDAQGIRDFLAWLRTEYKPVRFSGSEHPLSPMTIRNAWIALCAFFR